MVFRVTEFAAYGSGRPFSLGIPTMAPIQVQVIAPTATVSTFNLSSRTQLIFCDTDVGAYVFISSSGSTVVAAGGSSGTVQVSTAGASLRIPAGQLPFPIYVQPYSRVCVLST